MMELLELELDVPVAAGAIRTMLGEAVWTTKVAVSVLWVFGIASTCPLHIV